MIDIDKLIDYASGQRRRGLTLEEVLASLRAKGATIVDSLKVVRVVENVRLGEAKDLIDRSSTWADLRESNEILRSAALQALSENDDLK